MGKEFVVDSLEDMCALMCDNNTERLEERKMADIELVIKIPDKVMHKFYNGTLDEMEAGKCLISALVDAVTLPKGHGNIVDIEKLCEMFWDGNSMEITKDDLSVIEPIIEADKESEET